MDESWRKSMGISGVGNKTNGGTALEPEDFEDVFGGPPRSVLARKMSADFTRNEWFYNEIFRDPSELLDSPAIISGRKLPEFVIPERRRSKNRQVKSIMSRSKSTSSSIMSFDEENELNNFRSAAVIGEEDADFSCYTTKLRPLNVPSRWTKTSNSVMPKTNPKKQDLPTFGCTKANDRFIANECNDYMIQPFNVGYFQTVTSPENISSKHPAFRMEVTDDCGEYETQHSQNSSVVSSSHHHQSHTTTNIKYDECIIPCQQPCHIGSEVSNSEAINIVEAIAWAKEKFYGWSINDNDQGINYK